MILGKGTYGVVRKDGEFATKQTHLYYKGSVEPWNIREAVFMASWSGLPNIIKCHDIGLSEDKKNIVIKMDLYSDTLMKWCTGDKNSEISDDMRKSVFMQILTGMHALHVSGFVHGDIKPNNIMVNAERDGNVTATIIDFGNTIPDTHMSGVLNTNHCGCTYAYCAPELLRDAPYTQSGDAFSLGAVLYFILFGTHIMTATTVEEAREWHANGNMCKLLQHVDTGKWYSPILLGLLDSCTDTRLSVADAYTLLHDSRLQAKVALLPVSSSILASSRDAAVRRMAATIKLVFRAPYSSVLACAVNIMDMYHTHNKIVTLRTLDAFLYIAWCMFDGNYTYLPKLEVDKEVVNVLVSTKFRLYGDTAFTILRKVYRLGEVDYEKLEHALCLSSDVWEVCQHYIEDSENVLDRKAKRQKTCK